jgi:tetratricopeptide (TPR) repeat protein
MGKPKLGPRPGPHPLPVPEPPAEALREPAPSFLWSTLLPLGALAVLVALTFSNTFANGFHLDDYYRILNNPGITRVNPIWRHFIDPATSASLKSIQQYRPLLPLTLSLNYAVGGLNPAGYHLVSLALHLTAAVFFYLFFLTLLTGWGQGFPAGAGVKGAAWGAAALFAVHPVSGFPVNYLCARDLLLMQAALGGSLYCYLRLRRDGATAGRWALTLFLFLLALLSKTNAVVMILVVFLFETLAAGETIWSRRPWLRVLPFVLVAGLFLAFARLVLGFSDLDQALADSWFSYGYLLTQFKLHLFHYLRNLVWPFYVRGMPLVAPAASLLEPRVLLGLALIAASLLAAWLARRRAPVVAFAAFAYWATMLPESSFLPLHQMASAYRGYPGLPYLALVVAVLLFQYFPRRAAGLTLAALLLYFGVSAYVLNRNYLDDKSFWAHSVRYGGDEVATMNYGLCFRGQDEATARKYLEEALKINPNYYLGYINLGLFYIDQGEEDKGLKLVDQGVEHSPPNSLDRSLLWLAVAHERVEDYPGAYDAIVRALDYDDKDVDILYEAAIISEKLMRYEEALGYLAVLHQQEANFKLSRSLAGWCHQALGHPDLAVAEYELALRYTPDHAQTYANLGYALMSLGRFQEASRYFERFLQLEPQNQEGRAALKACRDAAR